MLIDSGQLSIVDGTPADDPRLPPEVNGAMNIANVFLPAYLYKTSDAKVKFIQYKDIKCLILLNLSKELKT